MSYRWQRFVFIATPTVIILLNVHNYHQRRSSIISAIDRYQLPIEKPDYFLGPQELIDLEIKTEEYKQKFEERKDIIGDAKRLGIEYQWTATREELEEKIRIHKHESLLAAAKEKQEKMRFVGRYAPDRIENQTEIWNLGLIGLATVTIESTEVMQYELTNASAWLLGFNKEMKIDCWFCAIQISFSEAKELADHLSLSTGRMPCYESEYRSKDCDGWRLPNVKEWEVARGGLEQKWEYLVANDKEAKSKCGTVSPNINNLFDIVGNVPEWTENEESIGATEKATTIPNSHSGLRLYREL